MMEILTLQDNREEAVEKSIEVVKGGGLVVVPTDTVYGIIGDGTRTETIERLYALKARPKEKAFPVFVRDIPMARWFAYISDAKARFLERVWPGPLTVIFHHKEKLPSVLTAGGDTIALRIPNHSFVSTLLARGTIPLIQSSANISGIAPAKNCADVIASFEQENQTPDLLIDGGETAGMPSTVIDFTGNQPCLVRSGVMTREDIDLFFKSMAEARFTEKTT